VKDLDLLFKAGAVLLAFATMLGCQGLDTGKLTVSPSSMSFGNVPIGQSQTQQATLSNYGGSSLTLNQVMVSGTGFSISGLSLPLTLVRGQRVTMTVTFTPSSSGSTSGTVSLLGSISMLDPGGQKPKELSSISTLSSVPTSLSLPVSGAGIMTGQLLATPPSLSFGSVQIGSSTTRSETLTNSGSSSVTVTQANVTGSGFSVTGLSLPMALSPKQSFTFGVAFAPTSAGSASGSISVVSDAPNPNLTIALAGSGTAAGQLSVSPGTLSFGSVVVGTSKSLSASLSASGASVTVSSATFGTSEFTLSGISFPLMLAAGQSASFAISFRPQASGSASDSASFWSNASNSPAVETLSGNGTAPPQHSVSLSWNASTSSVIGYNVYRSSATGGPYAKINSALNASTNYTDTSVQAGQTYYYATTAVDGSGLESGYSNQVEAVIPSP
jgi:Abnormal spindle-like microcephaly-assoc'd, ASPM-SPD-2-Hydin